MRTCHKRRSRWTPALAIAFTIPLAGALGGCENYLEESTSRTVGEFTDDTTIHMIVKRRLIAAEDVRGMRINVEVDKGIVTLIGKVRSEEERKRALEIAAGVPNVAKVVNQLEVP
ncbi:MAG: BON domain-containing protein [Gammaproteobacteria bacterium]|nr:BON domain-containing protein [Gammaproteobacteria bacterium]